MDQVDIKKKVTSGLSPIDFLKKLEDLQKKIINLYSISTSREKVKDLLEMQLSLLRNFINSDEFSKFASDYKSNNIASKFLNLQKDTDELLKLTKQNNQSDSNNVLDDYKDDFVSLEGFERSVLEVANNRKKSSKLLKRTPLKAAVIAFLISFGVFASESDITSKEVSSKPSVSINHVNFDNMTSLKELKKVCQDFNIDSLSNLPLNEATNLFKKAYSLYFGDNEIELISNYSSEKILPLGNIEQLLGIKMDISNVINAKLFLANNDPSFFDVYYDKMNFPIMGEKGPVTEDMRKEFDDNLLKIIYDSMLLLERNGVKYKVSKQFKKIIRNNKDFNHEFTNMYKDNLDLRKELVKISLSFPVYKYDNGFDLTKDFYELYSKIDKPTINEKNLIDYLKKRIVFSENIISGKVSRDFCDRKGRLNAKKIKTYLANLDNLNFFEVHLILKNKNELDRYKKIASDLKY